MSTAAQEVKFRGGKYMVSGTIKPVDDGMIEVSFRYNKTLITEFKSFEGARWNPEKKRWRFKDSARNQFQLDYLLGKDPYARFDAPYVDYLTERPLMAHQIEMVRHGLTRRCCILAAEMGTGKSLSAIEIMEASGFRDWWWVAPKSALRSVELELEKWKCKVRPRFITYDGLKRIITEWVPGAKAPHGVVFDESSRIKNPTAQRSQAAMELANGVRNDWGDEGYVILMSGTPAPKSPVDWWHQVEVAQPGFLREGTLEKCKARLGIIVEKESIQGGVFPHLVTWKDDAKKCGACGALETHPSHDPISMVTGEHGAFHAYVPGVNEVENLYKRMLGLVLVKFKKSCLDLPDKRYEVIRLKPSASTLRAASLIAARSTTVIGAMTLLRELSDGFQYQEEDGAVVACSLCKGDRTIIAPVMVENPDDWDADRDPVFVDRAINCPHCGGLGETVTSNRVAVEVECPKVDAVRELLDVYDDVGRTVFYGGFSGSVDRVVKTCLEAKWEVVRVDGRGPWWASWGKVCEVEMLKTFQAGATDDHPRIAFVGQPSAAGMGLTLTASPMIAYYSNDFNAESRIQSEDRVHRMGMDVNRGATIYDLIHLPTDEKVLANLQAKRALQAMSMGDLQNALSHMDRDAERTI